MKRSSQSRSTLKISGSQLLNSPTRTSTVSPPTFCSFNSAMTSRASATAAKLKAHSSPSEAKFDILCSNRSDISISSLRWLRPNRHGNGVPAPLAGTEPAGTPCRELVTLPDRSGGFKLRL